MLLNIWIRIKMTIENTINEMFEAEKAEEQAKIKKFLILFIFIPSPELGEGQGEV